MSTTQDLDPDAVDLSSFDLVLDVRPDATARTGLPGASSAPLDQLLASPQRFVSSTRAKVLLVCDIGMRSGFAARALTDLGYTSVVSLAGGIDEWRRHGLPLTGTEGLTRAQLERFDRQVKLPGIGASGQAGLLSATATVVGAGGLGVPAISYLAAAGLGTLRIVDPDVVELSNLQRQPIYRTEEVGTYKVESAARFVTELTPETRVENHTVALDASNAQSLLEESDVVIDATDSFDARYAISDACHRLGIPVVSGAVYRWEGQITTLDPDGPCYRCLFPEAPAAPQQLDCELIGAMGSVVATIGTMQATEAIKLASGGQSAYAGVLVLYDGASGRFTDVSVARRGDCPVCG